MIVPDWVRLLLYISVGVCPVWQDFFTKSTDYSLRGLMMPLISTVMVASVVVLARTKSQTPEIEPPHS